MLLPRNLDLLTTALLTLTCLLTPSTAIKIDLSSPDSIKAAAGTAAYNAMTFYNANQTGVGVPGNLPSPYYWWEAGALMMNMLEYWYLTGDTTYNDQVKEALLFQASSTNDFMPQNQTRDEGNDDQGFWAMGAMDAAEFKFPDPPQGQPQWLELVQGVFNDYTTRWEPAYCGGGMRWQIQSVNVGWDYKNSVSNGAFFHLAARLARYNPKNNTFVDWANKVWDWERRVGFIDDDYNVFDGGHIVPNCTDIDRNTWSYNGGLFVYGAANMYNLTNDRKWLDHTNGLIKALTRNNFKNSVLFEICEPSGQCNNDQVTFKAYTARWLAATTQLVPSTAQAIQPLIAASAQGAAQACVGPAKSNPAGTSIDGSTCGLSWLKGGYDGQSSPGEQMAAMSIFQNNMLFVDEGRSAPAPPVSLGNGGTSEGNPNAGQASGSDQSPPVPMRPITTADRAGAVILTILAAAGTVGACVFMVME